MEDSTRADPEHLAKRALLEYAQQIINGSADAINSVIAPHPVKG